MTWAGKGSTRAWRRARLAVLERDGYQCKIGGPTCLGTADQVHHKLGRGVGEDMADLEAACSPCNHAAGNPQAGADPQPSRRTQW